MPTPRLPLFAACTLALLAACSGSAPHTPAHHAADAAGNGHADTTIIENARVFDGEKDLGQVSLLIADGRIQRITQAGDTDLPTDARRIDHAGRYIIPGLINNHAHVGNTQGIEHGDRFYTEEIVARDLRQFQAYGVTTVVALGMNGRAFYDIRNALRDQPMRGAQLFGAGAGIGAVAGAPPATNMGLADDPVARPADAAAARAAVREQIDAGVDFIKLWVDDLGGSAPPMPAEVYRAAIDEAHRHGKLVAAHIHDLAPAADLVASGVDIIAHGVRDAPISQTMLNAMREAGTGYIATLQIDEANYLYAEHPEWLQQPFLRAALPDALYAQFANPQWQQQKLADPATARHRAALAMNLRNLDTLRQAGIHIGFGTDAGALPQRVPGFAEHRELELMQQAGYSPQHALTTATRDAARLQKFDDRGLLQAGMRADFIVLDADPLTDIRHTRRIHEVWQAGQRVAGPVAQYVHGKVD